MVVGFRGFRLGGCCGERDGHGQARTGRDESGFGTTQPFVLKAVGVPAFYPPGGTRRLHGGQDARHYEGKVFKTLIEIIAWLGHLYFTWNMNNWMS